MTTKGTCSLYLDEPVRAVMLSVARHTPAEPGRYLLPELWCLHLYDWHGSVDVEGARVLIRPGAFHVVAPATQLSYHYAEVSRHLVAHFRVPVPGAPAIEVPSMTHQHPNAAVLRKQFLQAIELGVGQRQADAILWSILWDLARAPRMGTSRDPRVAHACRMLEHRLQQPLSVARLARDAGVSHNQLTRLFRRYLGKTVVQYVKQRRIDNARHLLEHTDLPVAEVGVQVGIDDPQQFNKTFRQVVGVAPSHYRGRKDM